MLMPEVKQTLVGLGKVTVPLAKLEPAVDPMVPRVESSNCRQSLLEFLLDAVENMLGMLDRGFVYFAATRLPEKHHTDADYDAPDLCRDVPPRPGVGARACVTVSLESHGDAFVVLRPYGRGPLM